MFMILSGWVTTFLNGYVFSVASTLATDLWPIALAWLTVYIANYGHSVMRGEVNEPIGTFAWKMMKMAFILMLATGIGYYMNLIASTASGLQDGMATVFLQAAGGGGYGQAAPATVFGALDAANNSANDIMKLIWKDAGFYRLDLLVAAVVFGLGTAMFLIVGAFVALLSKIVLTFALAIGPIAILCLMFKPTAKFFDSWMSLVLSAVVLSWFVFFALGLSFYVANQMLLGVQQSGAFVGGNGAGQAGAIEAASTYLTIMALLAILLYQSPSLAGSLTGGSTIQMGYQMISNTAVAARAIMGNRNSDSDSSKPSNGAGGSMQRIPGSAGTAANAAVSAGRRAAFQRVAARGSRS